MPYNQPFQEINREALEAYMIEGAWVVANMRQKARPAPKRGRNPQKKES